MINENPYIDYFGRLYPVKNYINLIKNDCFYAGDLEISQSIFRFKINIAVYFSDEKQYKYKYQLFYSLNKNELLKNPLLILN